MAVGDILRRLCCKLAIRDLRDQFGSHFLPSQLGISTPNGAEAIVYAVTSALENLREDECILQVDFANAFNTVSRKVMLDIVSEQFPTLFNLVILS